MMNRLRSLRSGPDALSSLRKTGITIVLAVPVFFAFVFMAQRGGFHVLNWNRIETVSPFPIYLGDFSLVFTSRLLLGSVTKLFSEQLTLPQINAICGISVVISLAVLSLVCGAVLRTGIEKKNGVLVFAAILLMLNPLVAQENLFIYGSYDTYWLILFVVMLFFSKYDCFYLLAPVLCFTATLVHFGFIVSFFPAILTILIYRFFNEKKKGKSLAAASFCLSGIACAGLLYYSLFIANDHLSMNLEEFHEYILSRLKLTGVEEIRLQRLYGERMFPLDFFEGYFFGSLEDVNARTDFSQLIDMMLRPLRNASRDIYAGYLIATLPYLAIFTVLWAVCAKYKKGKEKIPFVCFILIQFVMAVGVLISTDLWRWTSAAMISQFGVLYFVLLVKKDRTVSDVTGSVFLKKWWVAALAAAGGIIYVVYLWNFGRALPAIPSDMDILLSY